MFISDNHTVVVGGRPRSIALHAMDQSWGGVIAAGAFVAAAGEL